MSRPLLKDDGVIVEFYATLASVSRAGESVVPENSICLIFGGFPTVVA